jgi:hypothetical protein
VEFWASLSPIHRARLEEVLSKTIDGAKALLEDLIDLSQKLPLDTSGVAFELAQFFGDPEHELRTQDHVAGSIQANQNSLEEIETEWRLIQAIKNGELEGLPPAACLTRQVLVTYLISGDEGKGDAGQHGRQGGTSSGAGGSQ